MARGYMEDVKRSKTYDEFKFRRPDIVRTHKGTFGKNKGKNIPGLTKAGFLNLKGAGDGIMTRKTTKKGGGTVKKQVGGLPQGYNARLDESLAARNRGARGNLADRARGNLAARRAESIGEERALGRRPYAAVGTMAKKGGSVRRKKGSTVSRKSGGKIMQGYKAGGKV